MRNASLLTFGLSLCLAACPADAPTEPQVASGGSAAKVPAPAAPRGAAPSVVISRDGELPELDPCGALADSDNRCGPVTSLSAAVPGDVCLPPGQSEASMAAVQSLAWRTFVALTWPSTAGGTPADSGPIAATQGADAPRAMWETWRSPWEMKELARLNEDAPLTTADWGRPAPLPSSCEGDPGALLLSQAGKVSDAVHAVLPDGIAASVRGGAAIDQNGQPVLVETRFNQTMWDTLVSGGWYCSGASDRGLAFPNNHGDTKYGVGAMAVQAAWVLMDDAQETDASIHTREAFVFQEGNAVRPGMCDKATVGLVALSVAHKAGVGDDTWVWSVFEQDGVAPMPGEPSSREYMFRSSTCAEMTEAACGSVQPGQVSEAVLCCPNTDLHGRLSATDRLVSDRTPSQLSREDRWEDGSGCTAAYTDALAGSPWANFALIGAQYWGNRDAETMEFGPQPRTLRSVVLEPWAVAWVDDKQDTTSSCIACHAAGDDSMFFVQAMRAGTDGGASQGSSETGVSPSEPTSAPE